MRLPALGCSLDSIVNILCLARYSPILTYLIIASSANTYAKLSATSLVRHPTKMPHPHSNSNRRISRTPLKPWLPSSVESPELQPQPFLSHHLAQFLQSFGHCFWLSGYATRVGIVNQWLKERDCGIEQSHFFLVLRGHVH